MSPFASLGLQPMLTTARYLYITGRSKKVINKGGEVILPFEIEEVVAILPAEDCLEVCSLCVLRFIVVVDLPPRRPCSRSR